MAGTYTDSICSGGNGALTVNSHTSPTTVSSVGVCVYPPEVGGARDKRGIWGVYIFVLTFRGYKLQIGKICAQIDAA